MRVTVDLSPAAHRHAGLGRYAESLLRALVALPTGDTYRALYYTGGPTRVPADLAALPTTQVPLGAKPWRMGVLAATLTGVSLDRAFPPMDVFHATEHLLPPLRAARTVFTIHDLIPLLFPEHHLPLNRWYLGLMLPRFLRRADAIIAVSEHTKRDVVRVVGLPEERITVIPEAAAPDLQPVHDPARRAAVRARYQLPESYLLYLGTIEPRKNLTTLFDAYAALLTRRAMPDLVIAGRRGWLWEPTIARVHALGIAERVRFTDWVDGADIPALLSGATAFLFPSRYEGFGLPPLEAMACGAPVICADSSSLPEVVGDAGLLVPPTDTAGFARAIDRVLEDEALRQRLRAQGLARAATFSWERAAQTTHAVYRTVVSVGANRR